MRTKLLLISFVLLSWQAVAIITTLHDRLESRTNQIERLLEDI